MVDEVPSTDGESLMLQEIAPSQYHRRGLDRKQNAPQALLMQVLFGDFPERIFRDEEPQQEDATSMRPTKAAFAEAIAGGWRDQTVRHLNRAGFQHQSSNKTTNLSSLTSLQGTLQPHGIVTFPRPAPHPRV